MRFGLSVACALLVMAVPLGCGGGGGGDTKSSINPEQVRDTTASSTTTLIERLDRAIAFAQQDGIVHRTLETLTRVNQVCTDSSNTEGNQTGFIESRNNCDFLLDTDLYETDTRRRLQTFLNNRVLIQSNVSSNPGPSVTYRLKGETICEGPPAAENRGGTARQGLRADAGTSNPSGRNSPGSSNRSGSRSVRASRCIQAFNQSEWRIRATRNGGGVRLELFVGPDRIRIGSVRFQSSKQVWSLDLAEARRAADYLESVYAEVEDWNESEYEGFWESISDDVSGQIQATLASSGLRQFNVDVTLQSVNIAGDDIALSFPTSRPILSGKVDGRAETASATLALPELTASFPYTIYDYYRDPEGPSRDYERRAKEFDVRLHLAKTRIRMALDQSSGQLSLDPLALGQGGESWLELDGDRVVRAQRTGGNPLSITGTTEDSQTSVLTVNGNWTFSTRFNFEPTGDKLETARWLDAGRWIAEIAADTEVVWHADDRNLEIRSGEGTVRDEQAGVETTLRGGQCIVDNESPRSQVSYYHPIEAFRGGQCSTGP